MYSQCQLQWHLKLQHPHRHQFKSHPRKLNRLHRHRLEEADDAEENQCRLRPQREEPDLTLLRVRVQEEIVPAVPPPEMLSMEMATLRTTLSFKMENLISLKHVTCKAIYYYSLFIKLCQ